MTDDQPTTDGAPGIRVTVWSDYVCPFCYLETPVFERLRDELGERVEIEWRAFELRPDPVPTLDPDSQYLDDIWERSVRPMAEDRGMRLRRPPVQPRSRLALEAAEFARAAGRFPEMHRELYRAFFEEGRDIGDVEILVEIGERAGLDPEELRGALEDRRFRDKVLEDQIEARELGVSGVPTAVIAPHDAPLEDGVAVEGAQTFEDVRAAVRRVLDE